MENDNFILTTRSAREVKPAQIPLPLLRTQDKVWIHLTPRSEAELTVMLEKYDIHQLTIEDVFSLTSRLKLEKFPNYTFFSFRGFYLQNGHLVIKTFNFILHKKTLITITTEKRSTIFDLIENWDKHKLLLRQGPEFIIHRILDVETDKTLNIVHKLDEMVDSYEGLLLNFDLNVDIARVFEIRSNLQHIKKVIIIHKEVLDELGNRFPHYFKGESAAFFRDVRDHALKIIDTVDSIIQSISSALEAYITISTRKTNDIMRILTILTALVLPMTFITGVYGMNFSQMPFLSRPDGFWLTLAFMTCVGLAMIFYFKVKKWL